MLARFKQAVRARLSKTEPTILKPPFRRFGTLGWISAAPRGGDDHAAPYLSELCLLENGTKILHGHMPHWVIDRVGGGRFSHWKKWIFFSTRDGSDPNSNGRVYAFDFSLDQKTWDRERHARSARRWAMHRRGAYFSERGGDLFARHH